MINKRTVALAKMANVNERESAQTIHTHLQKRLCLGGYMSHHADEEFGWFFFSGKRAIQCHNFRG